MIIIIIIIVNCFVGFYPSKKAETENKGIIDCHFKYIPGMVRRQPPCPY